MVRPFTTVEPWLGFAVSAALVGLGHRRRWIDLGFLRPGSERQYGRRRQGGQELLSHDLFPESPCSA
jgi:hypothetical protein